MCAVSPPHSQLDPAEVGFVAEHRPIVRMDDGQQAELEKIPRRIVEQFSQCGVDTHQLAAVVRTQGAHCHAAGRVLESEPEAFRARPELVNRLHERRVQASVIDRDGGLRRQHLEELVQGGLVSSDTAKAAHAVAKPSGGKRGARQAAAG